MKLVYTPYRGKVEPITKVHKANIELNDDFIEVVSYYEFDCFEADTLIKRPDTYKAIDILKKKDVTGLSIDYFYHEGDPDKEAYPRVVVSGVCNSIHIWLGEETVYEIYSQIKDWMLK